MKWEIKYRVIVEAQDEQDAQIKAVKEVQLGNLEFLEIELYD